jgi:hypothetical protein
MYDYKKNKQNKQTKQNKQNKQTKQTKQNKTTQNRSEFFKDGMEENGRREPSPNHSK